MSKILITGATGLIGKELLKALAGRHELIVLGRHKPELDSVSWIECDLGRHGLPDALPGGVDAVIHLAQSNNFRNFPDQAGDIFEINVGSLQRLLQWACAQGVKKFIYASSGGVYGTGENPFKEDAPLQSSKGLGFYLATKSCGEALADAYSDLMVVVALRFFFVYGPEQKQTMLIPRLVESVRNGKPIQLDGSDGIKINPIYVDDAVRAITSALDLPRSEKINVGGAETMTLRQIGEAIGAALGQSPVFVTHPEAHPRHLVGDIEKMKKLLGPPSTCFADGVRRFAAK